MSGPQEAGSTVRVEDPGPRLIVQEPGQPKEAFSLVGPPPGSGEDGKWIVGRQPENEVVVANAAVSRRHAQVEERADGFWLTDLGSTNGTSVNGRRLQPQTAQKLQDGDIIRIGDQHGNSVSLTFVSGIDQRGKKGLIRLDHLKDVSGLPSYTIGRDPTNQVRLAHPAVSRQHARMESTPAGHVLSDLNSTNGTFVNGRKLAKPTLVKAGDVIQIGPFRLQYEREGLTQASPEGLYRLDGLHLNRGVPVGGALRRVLGGPGATRLILNDVSLSIYPREFVGLVGGSGAGKSTLLKALTGFAPAQGRVLINGDDLYANYGAYESIFGYVPQDDIIHGQLSVRGALTYSAELRLPDATPEEVVRRVDDVLEQVEMTAHAAKQVSRLSGGQRKRVSIAVELLAGPGLFFLDEPTSGLDPGLEKKMMYTLRQLADGGRTVILVTHATANITQCTYVAFMADGRLVYFGPPQDALAFFGAGDFADIYTRLTQPLDPVHNPPPPGWAGPDGKAGAAAATGTNEGRTGPAGPAAGGETPPMSPDQHDGPAARDAAGGAANDPGPLPVPGAAPANGTPAAPVVPLPAGGGAAQGSPSASAEPAGGALPPRGPALRATGTASPGAQQPFATAAEAWEACFRNSHLYQEHVVARLRTMAPASAPDAGAGAARPAEPAGPSASSPSYRPERPTVSNLRQFGVLARRNLNLVWRDPLSLFILLAAMPIIGIFLLLMSHAGDLTGIWPQMAAGTLAPDLAGQALTQAAQAQRIMFMLALAANLLGIFGAAYELIKEDAIYRRERMVNLKILPYLGSKIAVLGGFALLQCALLLIVLHFKVAYPHDGIITSPVVEMYITLVLTTVASICLGLLISSVSRSSDMVVYLILLVLFVQIIFAGAIFPLEGSVKLVSDISATHWGLQALGSIAALPASGFYVDYNHNLGHLLLPWGVLIGFAVVCTALTALSQKGKDTV
jgi:ABC-type multidrug transport system ATPase subunit/pSer/pThr/pTyr-binding forkhead associated (FHA) protein